MNNGPKITYTKIKSKERYKLLKRYDRFCLRKQQKKGEQTIGHRSQRTQRPI